MPLRPPATPPTMRLTGQSPFFTAAATGIIYEQPDVKQPPHKRRRLAAATDRSGAANGAAAAANSRVELTSDVADADVAGLASRPSSSAATGSGKANTAGSGTGSGSASGLGSGAGTEHKRHSKTTTTTTVTATTTTSSSHQSLASSSTRPRSTRSQLRSAKPPPPSSQSPPPQPPRSPAAASPARPLRTRSSLAHGSHGPTSMPTPPASRRPPRSLHHSRRFTSAGAAAALAVSHGEAYKPREERGWEEFHPDLDIDARIAVFSAEEVDGVQSRDSDDEDSQQPPVSSSSAASRRRGGGRNQYSPRLPKLVPPPIPIVPDGATVGGGGGGQTLTLPKPQFARKDPFLTFDSDRAGQQNYVDRTMASVGYQESDLFVRNSRGYIRMTEGAAEEDFDLEVSTSAANPDAAIGGAGVGRVEYDMDEQDDKWLEEYNAHRRAEQYEPIKPAIFEITMTKIEKEWYALEKRIPKPNPKPPQTQRPRSSSAAAVNGEHDGGDELDSKCAVCDDGDCENSNAIVFCDGCDLAVHQECYGVPFIPEGQWLCRKCQLIGPSSPCCSFCPNTEGAFKQTNTSKWAHLLCAIWIPEVALGNPTLMEPIIDVEKIPRGRWKLTCYICRQKMGACIQCANKNCFVAFHVTCARRARLYTKMKVGPGATAIAESLNLKAYCDKHVPDDWREEHDVDTALAETMEYYRVTMAGRRWPDSQAAALSLGSSSDEETDGAEIPPRLADFEKRSRLTLTVGGGGTGGGKGGVRKRTAPPARTVWKLPSGAPVIPQVILDKVITALGRFTVRQRKQYAEDACKYWTLKREARRGAALLKRLQLQLEIFSSMEMTRRNFAGMGVAGAVRLQRRTAFADHLYTDVDRVRILCDEVKKRERDKLKDAEMLREIVDLVYFPLMDLMWPILDRAVRLDAKTRYFSTGLLRVREKLELRAYGSTRELSKDLADIFTQELGISSVADTAQLLEQIEGRATDLDAEIREKRKLAKRIMKAIQPLLEDALKKESELSGKPFEKELEHLDALFSEGLLSRRGSVAQPDTAQAITVANGDNGSSATTRVTEPVEVDRAGAGTIDELGPDVDVNAREGHADDVVRPEPLSPTHKNVETSAANDAQDVQEFNMTDAASQQQPLRGPSPAPEHGNAETTQAGGEHAVDEADAMPTIEATPLSAQVQPAAEPAPTAEASDIQPPAAEADLDNPLSSGGIMWYMKPFDPAGTTIHEERWTGREVLREMSEELSDFDDEEIEGLIDDDLDGGASGKKEQSGPPTRDRNGRFRRKGRGGAVGASTEAAAAANEGDAAQPLSSVAPPPSLSAPASSAEQRKPRRHKRRRFFY